MKNTILLILFIALQGNYAFAQAPLYKCSAYDTGGASSAIVCSDSLLNEVSKLQAYYYPADFAGMPSGAISSFYYRTSLITGLPDSVTYDYFAFGFKASSDSLLSIDTDGYAPFKYAVDIFDARPQYTVTGLSATGRWQKLSIGQPYLFHYDQNRNLVVEILWQSKIPFAWMCSNSYPGKMIVSQSGLAWGKSNGTLLDIGFDIETTDVTGVARLNNVRSFGLFPNPTTDSRFNISFNLAQPAKSIIITATDAMGRLVYLKTYSDIGKSFFREIDLSTVCKGVYFVKVSIDGEAIVRRVILE